MRDQDIAKAQAVIEAADAGAYDQQLGIDPEQRALLTKASSTEPLTRADISELARLNRPDLITAAYDAHRIEGL